MPELSKTLLKKIESLNEYLRDFDIDEIPLDKDLTSIQSDISKVSKELDDRFQLIKDKGDVQVIINELTANIEEFIEIELQKIDNWKEAQIQKLQDVATEAGIKLAQKIAAIFPNVSIPSTIQDITDFVNKMKTEIEEKVLITKTNIELMKDKEISKIIKKYE